MSLRFCPGGTVDISPAIHCRERATNSPRPSGTLESDSINRHASRWDAGIHRNRSQR